MVTLGWFLKVFTSLAFAADIFTFRVSSNLNNFDWGNGEVAQDLMLQLMEGLTRIDSNGNVVSAIASSWKQSGTRIEFVLRKNAKWSDGKPVCAEQFVKAWRRVLDPKTASPYSHVLFAVKNASEIAEGKTTPEKLGASADGCFLLKVDLNKPISFFSEITSHWVTFPVREGVTKEVVTTGPYAVSEIKKDQEVTAVKNQFYYQQNNGPDIIRAILLTDDNTALRLFESGKIDWIRDISIYEKKSGIQNKVVSKSLISYHLGFNFLKTDRKQRCQISQATPVLEIPSILMGNEQVASLWAENQKQSNNKALEIWYYAKDIHQPLMEWLQQVLKKNLGSTVKLIKSDSKSYWEKLRTNPPDIFLDGVTPFAIHSSAHFLEFQSKAIANWGKFHDSKYDALVESMGVLQTGDTRLKQIVESAEKILYQDECAVIPLYQRSIVNFVSNQWTGFQMNELGRVDFRSLKRK